MAEDELTAVITALDETGLYVAPSAAPMLTPDEVAAVTENLATLEAAGAPVYVVVADLQGQDFAGDMDNLLVSVHDETGGDGLYLGTDWFYEPAYVEENGGPEYTLTEQQWGTSVALPDTFDALDVDVVEPELGPALVRLTDALVSYATTSEQTEWLDYQEEVRETREESYAQSPSADGDGLGTGATAGILLGGVLLVALVVRAVRRRPSSAGAPAGTARDGAFVLPPSALELVRSARDAGVVGRARDELLALGEAVDAAELTPRGDAAAWQSALDHYDAARRVLRPEDPTDDVPLLDGVGGLVLAQRGRAALTAALRGRAYSPTPPCLLNPLHGPGENVRDVEVAGERLHAPLCNRCRRDLKKGARPEILDVMVDGRPRHYFESGVEPWASTGFGALQPDLVGAVHRLRQR
ncbi:hypothetical protein INN71_07875 [Nocardioides sp. ChNu-153]|uniref:hypothetical protein n=1 Tax=unclassified Nocardioides TaxID=2615069 RepID=UPI002405170B|nr:MULTISPECIES: hypothetical protein [unclassified Nocardioides]MDF9715637.1 hypothetical protein [Nocardioides sp. ChNu-99]MDN7121309.1 hypothetical protein [Nocardioides sp. ChNu-153]